MPPRKRRKRKASALADDASTSTTRASKRRRRNAAASASVDDHAGSTEESSVTATSTSQRRSRRKASTNALEQLSGKEEKKATPAPSRTGNRAGRRRSRRQTGNTGDEVSDDTLERALRKPTEAEVAKIPSDKRSVLRLSMSTLSMSRAELDLDEAIDELGKSVQEEVAKAKAHASSASLAASETTDKNRGSGGAKGGTSDTMARFSAKDVQSRTTTTITASSTASGTSTRRGKVTRGGNAPRQRYDAVPRHYVTRVAANSVFGLPDNYLPTAIPLPVRSADEERLYQQRDTAVARAIEHEQLHDLAPGRATHIAEDRIHKMIDTVKDTVSLEEHRVRFGDDLPDLMFGYGDSAHPHVDTVATLDAIVCEYITEMSRAAIELGGRSARLQDDAVTFLIRDDAKKLTRVKELAKLNKEINAARHATNANYKG